MNNIDEEREFSMLYDLLTELERLGCFDIKTSNAERKKITRYIMKVIKEHSEHELVEKGSGRWI